MEPIWAGNEALSNQQEKKPEKTKEQLEADRILKGVDEGAERLGFSNMDLLERPREDDGDDPVVIAGKRAGRGLGYVAVGILIVYLIKTYLL